MVLTKFNYHYDGNFESNSLDNHSIKTLADNRSGNGIKRTVSI